MKTSLEIKKEYYFRNDYELKLKSNQREQLWLLYTLHLISGQTEYELVEIYLDIIVPIPNKGNKYNSAISHRCKKRKELNGLIKKFLLLKNSYKS